MKFPGEVVPGESLRDGAATLLPRLERRRFVRAYHAVVNGRGGGDDAHLVARDLGGDLVTCYVHDEGWRFAYIVQARARAWDTTLDTIHSVARSNLYARAPIDHRASEVAVGDGYDASRVTLIGDVFYDRGGPDGLPVAVPGRDLLLVGPDLDPAAVRAAYAAAKYPLSPQVLRFHRGQVHPA